MQGMLYYLFLKGGTKEFNGVKVHSVELWDVQTGKLVAGELGSSVGSIYTSLTGFVVKDDTQDNNNNNNNNISILKSKKTRSRYSGCGTVQLAGLGKLLQKCGFQLWDLGMTMDYKVALGGIELPRMQFLQKYRHLRDLPNISLQCPSKHNAQEIIRNIDVPRNNDASATAAVEQKCDHEVGATTDDRHQDAPMSSSQHLNPPNVSKKHQKRLLRIQKRKDAKAKAKTEHEPNKQNNESSQNPVDEEMSLPDSKQTSQ
ncbi:Leu/Phe-tRNA protein transferase [Reticulomyxa filosa]|uniref:Leu/Phe-tRNA protein transferase n=1 Tax=Reticulomyxa filosa TaxID=46433 RepID=X6M5Y5_RETFI|nr:Leu/Phe-tRNA protein transferase [Reticulomyxa filosa]|eukprot:ETO09339.1 Leu/Phe-tRNA protein transferase [Reticulomyxa filosa]